MSRAEPRGDGTKYLKRGDGKRHHVSERNEREVGCCLIDLFFYPGVISFISQKHSSFFIYFLKCRITIPAVFKKYLKNHKLQSLCNIFFLLYFDISSCFSSRPHSRKFFLFFFFFNQACTLTCTCQRCFKEFCFWVKTRRRGKREKMRMEKWRNMMDW